METETMTVGLPSSDEVHTTTKNQWAKTNRKKTKTLKYCAKSTLIERGWTASAIDRWLGSPDDFARNPHHKSGPPMLLYSLRRVANAEAKSDWIAWRERMEIKRAAHPDSGAKAVATKVRKIQEYVDGITITLPTMTKEDLIKNACAHYNAINLGNGKYASPSDSDEFLHRIADNYLRHTQSNYHEHLSTIAGKVGCDGAYRAIRSKIDDAIRTQYPFLMVYR